MSCPQCQGIERLFDRKTADRELKSYRAHGPGKTTRLLLDALKKSGIDGLTLLDIGGGVGAIQHDLLEAGARSATVVDASTAYIRTSRQEAERQGHADRVTYKHGDFVTLAPQLPPADIVTLEKVICCYDDMPALVKLSSARARKYYGIVFPRDTWWIKAGGWLGNFIQGIFRHPFRVFVYPTREVEAVVRESGLKRQFYQKTLFWQVIVYVR